MRRSLQLYQIKALNTSWPNNSNTLNMHRKISRKQLFAWVLPTINSSFFIHYAVWPINYSSLAIVCNSMWVNYKMSFDHFRSKLSFQVPIIHTYNNCLLTMSPLFTENNFNFRYQMALYLHCIWLAHGAAFMHTLNTNRWNRSAAQSFWS